MSIRILVSMQVIQDTERRHCQHVHSQGITSIKPKSDGFVQ